MATLVFAYDHSRDPMNPGDLAERIATQGNLTVQPQVSIDPTSITVQHPSITEANRASIQTIINAYSLDPVRSSYPEGNMGSLLTKAKKAIDTNNAFLALGPNPTTAQVRDFALASARELNALIKIILNDASDTAGT